MKQTNISQTIITLQNITSTLTNMSNGFSMLGMNTVTNLLCGITSTLAIEIETLNEIETQLKQTDDMNAFDDDIPF